MIAPVGLATEVAEPAADVVGLNVCVGDAMDFDAVTNAVGLYLRTFDGTKALQIAYYTVALIVASIGLWKTIRYAEGKMPKRLLEFASRFEGQIIEKKLRVLGRIRALPMATPSKDYLDVNEEMDRAMRFLDKGDPERAASELELLATRLEEKIKVAEAQLSLTKQQTASVQLLFGSLAMKIPQRAGQSLSALKRTIELTPDDPEGHKELGLLKKDAKDYEGARVHFDTYFKSVGAATNRERGDRALLQIDARRMIAECHRLEGSPDKEKSELEAAIAIAESMNGTTAQPHALKAAVLEELGMNACNRKSPQTAKMEEFFDKSAAEFRLAGLSKEVARVLDKKIALTKKIAA